jgi:hypothetical protein
VRLLFFLLFLSGAIYLCTNFKSFYGYNHILLSELIYKIQYIVYVCYVVEINLETRVVKDALLDGVNYA